MIFAAVKWWALLVGVARAYHDPRSPARKVDAWIQTFMLAPYQRQMEAVAAERAAHPAMIVRWP